MIVDTLMADEKSTGIGIYTVNLVKHLSEYLDFTVITHSPELFRKDLKFKLAPKILAPLNGKKAAILRMFYLQTLRGKGLLYRTYHSISLFWAGKQIITIHDILPILFPERYKEQNYLFRYFLKPFINKVDYIFTVSQRSKEDIVNFFKLDESKVRVFYQGYNEDIFKPIPKEKVLQVKRRYGLFDYILVVGAQYIHKNVEIVIKTLPFLEPLQLVITGTREPYESRIMNEVERLNLRDRVRIFRYIPQEDLAGVYSGALLVAVPSKYEGFGIPVLEAMATGVPVVGTEAVKESGGDAIEYADPDDIDSWIQAINKVLNDRERYIKKGFDRVKKFSWKRTAKEISDFIKNIL